MATATLPKKTPARKRTYPTIGKASAVTKTRRLRRSPKSVSIDEVLAAGGAAKYALTKGIDPQTVKISGAIRLSRSETDWLQEQLRQQH